ncbi:MAG: hypothetical protein M1823_003256 [Watsoniomyces obsoletus]|nr:MAG: hypothetical protein M1823_003256 [Watsoniomyces obsoletus]
MDNTMTPTGLHAFLLMRGVREESGEVTIERYGKKATSDVKHASYAFAQLPNEVLIQIVSHLPPQSLSNVALVSRRFHDLVNSPHAWRIAFCRLFPGTDGLRSGGRNRDGFQSQDADDVGSGKRSFTRLTAFSTWRSEYILRTRLLRCLARGKPATALKSSGPSTSTRSTLDRGGRAAITYSSGLHTMVTQIHASFPAVQSKRLPRFVVGTHDNGCARRIDAAGPRIELWGTSDPQSFLQFEQRWVGESMWGLGEGNLVGLPNVMDLSQSFGMVHGEGSPGGLVYFRSTEEKRGRFLAFSTGVSVPELGVPKVPGTTEAICSVWIAKSMSIPAMTDGLIGVLSSSSSGVVTAYSLGTHGVEGQRLARGELTARWVVSPGVPIIAIAVDESYSSARRVSNRIWMAVLNALGEVFYLSDIPRRSLPPPGAKLNEQELELLAWETGRTVEWKLMAPSKRIARPDPFRENQFDATYSPTSPSNGMGLGREAIIAHTKEMEKFMSYKPKQFRTTCIGWDMRRRFEVDFAGNDPEISQSFVVINCGVDPDEPAHAQIKRYSLCSKTSSLDSQDARMDGKKPTGTSETLECRTSEFSLGPLEDTELTTTCIDHSDCALSTASEDPLLDDSILPETASRGSTPFSNYHQLLSAIPGQRARLMAAGTKSGCIILWDLRAATSSDPEIVSTILPIRIIQTDSPQITSLALTALYLVHGGNDCLVQAWDPLGSSTQPIRTLNSRFRTRARRRLIQAEGGVLDSNSNVYPAGAICLDPDSTVLRGMVSLGPHLRYWSYSSSGADQFTGRSRRLRRGPRRSNHAAGGLSSDFGRSSVEDYIESEKREFAHDEKMRQKEAGRLAGRFGVGMLGAGAGEEELAYALMLSEESFMQDEEKKRRSSGSDGSSSRSNSSVSSSQTITPEGSIAAIRVSSSPVSVFHEEDHHMDDDLAEALRRSLLDDSDPSMAESSASAADIPIRYAKNKSNRSASYSSSTSSPKGIATAIAGPSSGFDDPKELDDDLDFALQLSLAEERSRLVTSVDSPISSDAKAVSASAKHTMKAISEEEFPTLASSVSPPRTGSFDRKGKGIKGKSTRSVKSDDDKEKEKFKGKGKARSS